MMPELGKYAVDVIAAYGVSTIILLAIVLVSVWQARRARRALEQVETK